MSTPIAYSPAGRTPVFLGKKIEAYEVKMVSFAILLMPLLVLLTTALAVVLPAGRESVFNPGPQGLSEILYEFKSAVNNIMAVIWVA
jgi:K+-transporting ATPase ATPase A chain